MGRKTRERYEVDLHSSFAFDDLKKSNTLINAKGSGTLLAQKIFVIGLKYATYSDESRCMVSVVYGDQLKQILGVGGHSLYGNIQGVAENLSDWKIVYKDDENKEFMIANVIQKAHFKDGRLVILYNSELSRYMGDLLANYTILPLEEIMSLQSRYSFRLYEILKSKMDYTRAVKNVKGVVSWEVDITDLKLQIGIIDINSNKGIVKALKTNTPDYEKVEEMVSEPKYKTYKDFRKCVIDPAVDELNEKTNLIVSYKPVKQGRAVKMLQFMIDSKTAAGNKRNERSDLDDDMKLEAITSARVMLDRKLFAMSDVRKIAEAANYDVQKIEQAVECLEQAGEVKNPVGWMIAAIRDGYAKPASRQKRGSFSFAGERGGYDVIEDMILEK